MHFNGNPFKQSCLLQCLTTTKYGVADYRVVLLVETRGKRLSDGLLRKKRPMSRSPYR